MTGKNREKKREKRETNTEITQERNNVRARTRRGRLQGQAGDNKCLDDSLRNKKGKEPVRNKVTKQTSNSDLSQVSSDNKIKLKRQKRKNIASKFKSSRSYAQRTDNVR